ARTEARQVEEGRDQRAPGKGSTTERGAAATARRGWFRRQWRKPDAAPALGGAWPEPVGPALRLYGRADRDPPPLLRGGRDRAHPALQTHARQFGGEQNRLAAPRQPGQGKRLAIRG